MDDRWIALGVALAVAIGVWAASRLYRLWLARVRPSADLFQPLGIPTDGHPVVLGFTGEYCLPCKTQQHPALERLRARLGQSIHISEVDALEHADLAGRYGVLTVPTTVVLDGNRNVIAINYGVTQTEKLRRQLEPHLKPLSSARRLPLPDKTL
jgi:thioredoxin-like negative regulator of GroEL